MGFVMRSDLMHCLHEWDSFSLWSPTNNDLGPTPVDDDDYSPWWDTEQEWVYPHPDMEGTVCSGGWQHEPFQHAVVESVGLARLPLGAVPGWVTPLQGLNEENSDD